MRLNSQLMAANSSDLQGQRTVTAVHGNGIIAKWQCAFASRRSDGKMAGNKPQSSSAVVMEANGSAKEVNNLSYLASVLYLPSVLYFLKLGQIQHTWANT